MAHKLENPERIAELSPPTTLVRMGLREGGVLCDIGAGTGIFTFAAARMGADVYAVEISQQMRAILSAKRQEQRADNVHIEADVEDVPPASCDIALFCTVLHELADIPGMLAQVKRILRPGGTLAAIEFHKSGTPLGPPEQFRLSAEQLEEIFSRAGFCAKEVFPLGENFYALLAQQAE